MDEPLRLEWLLGRYAVCRFEAGANVPAWALDGGGFVSVTRTERELSIIAPQERIDDTVTAERDFIALRVQGTLDFAMVGVLARLTAALAEAGVPALCVSTYDTDVLLVKAANAQRAAEALAAVAEITPP
jgi:hypothetical protein